QQQQQQLLQHQQLQAHLLQQQAAQHAPGALPTAQPALPAAAVLQLQHHQQQRVPHLTGGWQSNNDIPHRKKILSRIVVYLQQRKPNARPEWIKKVPLMAKRLEDSLYRNAATFAEYNDMNTLRARLQQLALRLGNKAQQAKLQAGQ
ncbi:hypothetical protein JKP88DRAFT_151334, partial [Tribonema minus]